MGIQADDYETFSEFRRSLRLKCASDGYTGTFTWTPDASTPDTLYYQVCYTVNCSYTGLAGTTILSPIYPNTRLYKTYCEPFLRDSDILGPVCANSGIAKSDIRVIDCISISIWQIVSAYRFQSATSYNMGWRIHVVDSIPSDITDFKEEPYQYEIWLEHQSLREVPDGVNGSLRPVVGHFSLALLLLSLFILPYRIVS